MMLPDPLALAAAALFASALGLVLWLSHRREQQRRAACEALATTRGWDFDYRPAQGRHPALFVFDDPASGARLTITRKRSRKSGSSTTTSGGQTRVDLPAPTLPGGLVFYTGEQLAGLAGAASQLMGIFDNPLAKRLLGSLLGEEYGAHLGSLHEQPVVPGMPLTILGSVDPAPFHDPEAALRALRGWPESDKAMVAVTEIGTSLRLARDLRDAGEIETLFDAALRLGAELPR